MKKVLLVSFLFTFVVATGCTDPEAPQKCREIGEAYCAKVSAFCEAPGTPMPNVQECEDTFDLTVVCDDALYIDDEDNDCINDIDDIDECTFGLPASCIGVVVVNEKADDDDD